MYIDGFFFICLSNVFLFVFLLDGAAMTDVGTDKLSTGSSSQRWSDFHKRIVQHNIRVISKYYTEITSKRLSNLLNLDESKTEIYLSEMVSSGQLFAKIDRPIGQIRFAPTQTSLEQVNTWSADITSLLGLVESTCHMINKENMIHKIK
jgi:26S proteasome regulatory subunit N5